MTVVAPPESTDLIEALDRAGIAVGEIARVVPMHQRSLCYRVEMSDGAPLFVKRARRSAAASGPPTWSQKEFACNNSRHCCRHTTSSRHRF